MISGIGQGLYHTPSTGAPEGAQTRGTSRLLVFRAFGAGGCEGFPIAIYAARQKARKPEARPAYWCSAPSAREDATLPCFFLPVRQKAQKTSQRPANWLSAPSAREDATLSCCYLLVRRKAQKNQSASRQLVIRAFGAGVCDCTPCVLYAARPMRAARNVLGCPAWGVQRGRTAPLAGYRGSAPACMRPANWLSAPSARELVTWFPVVVYAARPLRAARNVLGTPVWEVQEGRTALLVGCRGAAPAVTPPHGHSGL